MNRCIRLQFCVCYSNTYLIWKCWHKCKNQKRGWWCHGLSDNKKKCWNVEVLLWGKVPLRQFSSWILHLFVIFSKGELFNYFFLIYEGTNFWLKSVNPIIFSFSLFFTIVTWQCLKSIVRFCNHNLVNKAFPHQLYYALW